MMDSRFSPLAEILADKGRWWTQFISHLNAAYCEGRVRIFSSPSAVKLRLLKKLRCTLRYEKIAWDAGATLVAGVDEVGRGSLFGPVVAAAVILERGYRIRGLRDSKLLLPERRELLAPRIREHAVAWAVAAVDAARIDQINIYHASRLAMREAVMRLQPARRSFADRRRAGGLRSAAKSHHPRGRTFGLDCGGFDSGQSRARPHDVRVGRSLPRVRPGFAQRATAPRSISPRCCEYGPSPLHRQSFAPVWSNPVEQEVFEFE